VRLFALSSIVLFYGLAVPGRSQVPDPGTVTANPGALQDEAAARDKLLKASDEIDMIQSNSESTKLALTAMKADIAQLQADNAALKEQITGLQAALDRSEAEREKERQALLDKVADLIANANKVAPKPAHRHVAAEEETSVAPEPHPSTEVHTPEGEPAAGPGATPAPPSRNPDNSGPGGPTAGETSLAPPPDPAPAPAPKPQKGYYHVVEAGETLTMICGAYRDKGVKVTVSQIRKANGLTEKSVLKVGEKLFIPKPGT
jgi:LysM repeat protein